MLGIPSTADRTVAFDAGTQSSTNALQNPHNIIASIGNDIVLYQLTLTDQAFEDIAMRMMVLVMAFQMSTTLELTLKTRSILTVVFRHPDMVLKRPKADRILLCLPLVIRSRMHPSHSNLQLLNLQVLLVMVLSILPESN